MAKKRLSIGLRSGRVRRKGIFITLEGVEGCGKSTQARLLYENLKAQSYECVLTREPGGTRAGEGIRGVLLNMKDASISDLTELFLFEAARAQIISEVIRPAIGSGKVVICDRFSDATVCYQGYAGGVSLKQIELLNNISTGGIKPDLTILLDIDTATGLKRARKKGVDRMEEKDLSYHRRVRSGYLKLAKKESGRIRVVRVLDGIEETFVSVMKEVGRVIRRNKRA